MRNPKIKWKLIIKEQNFIFVWHILPLVECHWRGVHRFVSHEKEERFKSQKEHITWTHNTKRDNDTTQIENDRKVLLLLREKLWQAENFLRLILVFACC